ncbi:Death-associated protein kinase 3 [Exaiptasia diaphana]|nr:Death-associated protein kinase 3 [Exaiptasia diaphana]
MPLIPGNPDNDYSIQEEIGRGKFAVVKKCLYRETKAPHAAKLIKFDDNEEKETAQEFDIHRNLSHPNIVSLYSGYIVQKYIVLILELLDKTNALTYLASKRKATEEDVANVIKNVLNALDYLHNKNVIHLDIRPANIMISQQQVKLIDFGSARRLHDKNGEVGAIVGNIEFTAPEMLSFEPVNASADMWSLGVTTYLLVGAELPFIGNDDDAVSEAIKKGTFEFEEDLFPSTTDNAKDFIESLICKFPNKRMDTAAAKEHVWLSDSFAAKRSEALIAEPDMLKGISDDLISEEDEELISASCVLRTFQEEAYQSPDESTYFLVSMASRVKSQTKYKNSVSMVSPQQLLLTFVHADDHSPVATSPVFTDDTNSIATRKEEGKRRTRVVWGASETRILLEVWGPKFEQIKGGTIAIKRDLWRNIATEFENACSKHHLANISMSLDQLRKRVANLEYKYRQVKVQLSVSDETEAHRLKAGFPFFDALDKVLGKTNINNNDFTRIHADSAALQSPSTSSVQDELDLPLTQDNTQSYIAEHDQIDETTGLIVVENPGNELKRKRSYDIDDEEPYLKQLCKLWEESLERQEQWFSRIMEMQEKMLANQTAQTKLLVEGLRDIVQELINSN